MDIGRPLRVIVVEPLDVELPIDVAPEAGPDQTEPVAATGPPEVRQHAVRADRAHSQTRQRR